MSTIISKMKYNDIWCTDDICAVLSEHNHEIGDESSFRKLLYSAKRSGKIKTVSDPFLIFEDSPEYQQYNFEYKQEEIVAWVSSKSFVFPISSDKNVSSNKKIESVNMNIIAGLLKALLGAGAGSAKNSRFEDQSSIINYLMDNVKLEGISKRTLEDRFAKANQILRQLDD